MQHAAVTRIYERQHVSKIGEGTRTVSRIGVVLFVREGGGTKGYRVARTLAEINASVLGNQ